MYGSDSDAIIIGRVSPIHRPPSSDEPASSDDNTSVCSSFFCRITHVHTRSQNADIVEGLDTALSNYRSMIKALCDVEGIDTNDLLADSQSHTTDVVSIESVSDISVGSNGSNNGIEE